MNKILSLTAGVLLLLLFLLFMMTYTVKYNEIAIRQRFAKETVIRDEGLQFRIVLVDKIAKLDRRMQLVETPLSEITTADNLQIVVRGFLLWKVDAEGDGPTAFFKKYTSTEGAVRALQANFRTAFTGELSKYRFGDLIGPESRLADAEQAVLASMTPSLTADGIEPVSVGISQVLLPPNTSKAVIDRMKATRDKIAEGERDIGQAEAERIRSRGNTDADKITTFAQTLAEEIRAEGERDAATYLGQMSEDPDFALFLIWLDQLERALNERTTIILPASGLAPFHLMDPTSVAMKNGIPMPNGEEATAADRETDRANEVGRASETDDAALRELARIARAQGHPDAANLLDRLVNGGADGASLLALLDEMAAAEAEVETETAAAGGEG